MGYRHDIKKNLPWRDGSIGMLLPAKPTLRGGEAAKTFHNQRRANLLANKEVLTLGVKETLAYHGRLKRQPWWVELHGANDPAGGMVPGLCRALERPPTIMDDGRRHLILALTNYWRWHDAHIHRVCRDWEKLRAQGGTLRTIPNMDRA